MPSITSIGVGSGLDVDSIVSQLMVLEKRPLQQLQSQASTMQTRISAFGAMKGQLANLGDVAARLASPDNWNPLKVDNSNTTAVAVTAGNAAAAGAHTLAVSRLAQPQVLASAPFASSSAVVGTGTLRIELGTTEDGVFTPKSGSSPTSITIDASRQTLSGVRDAINAAKAGVTASIVGSGADARLVLRGPDGASGSMRVTATDADGNNSDAAGLSALAHDPAAAAGAGRNLGETQAAQDALFKLDGIELRSATNTVTDALEGVTFTLRQETTAPVDLRISSDTAALKKNVSDFVGAYNALNSLLQGQTRADPSGVNRGPLQADSTANAVLNQLRSMLHGAVAGLAGNNSLVTAGIELQRDGTLKVNETRLAKTLEDPAQLAGLFAQKGAGDARGFGVRFKEWAQALTGETGTLQSRVSSLNRSVEANQKQQEAQEDRVARAEARLRAQYQRLDSEMSRLNGQMAQMVSALGLS